MRARIHSWNCERVTVAASMLFAAETVVILIAVYTANEMASFLRNRYLHSLFPTQVFITSTFLCLASCFLYIFLFESGTFYLIENIYVSSRSLPVLFLAHASSSYNLSAGPRTPTLILARTVRPDQPSQPTMTEHPKPLIYTRNVALCSLISRLLRSYIAQLPRRRGLSRGLEHDPCIRCCFYRTWPLTTTHYPLRR